MYWLRAWADEVQLSSLSTALWAGDYTEDDENLQYWFLICMWMTWILDGLRYLQLRRKMEPQITSSQSSAFKLQKTEQQILPPQLLILDIMKNNKTET